MSMETQINILKAIQGQRLKPWDFNKPSMKLSEIKRRAKLFKAGIK